MRKRAAPGTLNRQRIADAALGIADRHGMRGVTVRVVAAELGVSAMALYTYFSTKEQLFDRMFVRVLERLFEPAGQPTWQEELYVGCSHARDVLLAHPAWLPLLTRAHVPSNTLGIYERILDQMAGHTDATVAVSAAMSFTLGSVLVERMMTAERGVVIPIAQMAELRRMLPKVRSRYPRVASAASAFEEWTFRGVFDVGLRSLIAGIEERARRPPRAG